MRECDRHTSESQPGGGVCARCLTERLTWLWRGESFRHGDDTASQTTSSSAPTTSVAVDDHDSAQPQRHPDAAAFAESPEPSIAALSLASVRQQLQVLGVARQPRSTVVLVQIENPSDDAANPTAMAADPTTSTPQNSAKSQDSAKSQAVIEEWTAFHAQRRGNVEPELAVESPKAKSSRSFDSVESLSENGARPPVQQASPELRTLMNAQKMRSQSLPLNFCSAEETAARVINEQAGDYLDDELEMYEVRDGDGGGGGEAMVLQEQQHDVPRCFSPAWRSSPKWVKALASPLSSRNRVFPSRSKDTDVRKRSRSKRGARLDSSDWGFKDVNGGSSPLWRSRTLQRSSSRTRSMFSWLQDAETKQDKKHDQAEQQLTSSSSSSFSTDSWLRDLTTVGHLHEIAEELEIVEESSEEENEKDENEEQEEEELEDLGDVSSFGKFLLQAAQRHPNARLTRLVSVSSSQRL